MRMGKRGWQAVIVDWVDSAGMAGWHHRHDWAEHTVAKCRSIGWLLADTKEQITIALNHDRDGGGIGEVMAIPRVAIKRLRKLNEWSEPI